MHVLLQNQGAVKETAQDCFPLASPIFFRFCLFPVSGCLLYKQRQRERYFLRPSSPIHFAFNSIFYAPKVAAITALIVCIRFSASSKTTDCSDSNTSSVTSISLMPKRSPISLPIVVSRSWNAGRQ